MCSSIINLNFKNNNIESLDNIYYLSGLTNLQRLNLNNNPIQKQEGYLTFIKERLDCITSLDQDDDLEKKVDNSLCDLTKSCANFYKNESVKSITLERTADSSQELGLVPASMKTNSDFIKIKNKETFEINGIS